MICILASFFSWLYLNDQNFEYVFEKDIKGPLTQRMIGQEIKNGLLEKIKKKIRHFSEFPLKFEIKIGEDSEIKLSGWFDASQVEDAKNIFNKIDTTSTVSFNKLDYISSAGLGVLLMTQKRLKESGEQIILKGMNKHIREIFKYAGFDMIFKIED